MPTEQVIRVRTLDGLHLVGTLTSPDTPTGKGIVFVYGGGVTRDEAGSSRDWPLAWLLPVLRRCATTSADMVRAKVARNTVR